MEVADTAFLQEVGRSALHLGGWAFLLGVIAELVAVVVAASRKPEDKNGELFTIIPTIGTLVSGLKDMSAGKALVVASLGFYVVAVHAAQLVAYPPDDEAEEASNEADNAPSTGDTAPVD